MKSKGKILSDRLQCQMHILIVSGQSDQDRTQLVPNQLAASIEKSSNSRFDDTITARLP